MRLKFRRQAQHRASHADRIVHTPTMARRPFTGDPAEAQLMAAAPGGDFLTRELPAVSPAAVLPPYPHTAFSPMSGHFAPPPPLDVTQVLPVVRQQRPAADSTTTQVLPRIPAALSPSAQHADPAHLYYERTFVEDDGLAPHSPGRHVLDELKAMPDPAEELAAAPARIIKALGGRESEVRNPALRVAVRLFRHARDMQRAREVRARRAMDEADACSRMMREFGEKWDAKIRKEEIKRHGQRAVAQAEELTAAYEENRLRVAEENARRAADGRAPLDATATTFTRDMADKIQRMLVDEAKASSVGVR